jgi:glutathione S-transferase
MRLHDNAFSPFARKVRLVLDHKGLAFEAVDALTPAGRERLARVNPRVEVPVLEDGDLVVVNSAHIVAYLEHRYPTPPVYPADPARRVAALAWELRADTLLDAIVHDASNGGLGFGAEPPPAGLLEAARADLDPVYADLERALAGQDFLCGDLSIADLAVFPHLTAVRFLGVSFDGTARPRLLAWYKRMRALAICRADLARAQAWLDAFRASPPAADRIVWRGDRIEWLLGHGFHEWFFEQIRRNRVAWPGRPGPR